VSSIDDLIIGQVREELDGILRVLTEKEDRLKQVGKHLKLMRIQRQRVEKIERSLEKHQVLIFFDYTKYNYLCHDLGFVLLYRDQKNIIQRKYFHYLYSKWDKHGNKVPNDAKYTITCFKLFFKRLDKFWEEVSKTEPFNIDGPIYPKWKDIFLASDGGPHFINAQFIDYLTRMKIVEWNRFAPHHGGNYCDGEFGVCKCSLRRYEAVNGQQKCVEDIFEVLKAQVSKRDTEFVLLESIETDEDIDYTYKSPSFPHGIKDWYCLHFKGENHIVYYYEYYDENAEWYSQKINARAKFYEPDMEEWRIEEENKTTFPEEKDMEDEKEEVEEKEEDEEEDEEEDQTVIAIEVEGKYDDESEEVSHRHCYGCELIIEEGKGTKGFLKCSDYGCPKIFHFGCHDTSYSSIETVPFRCKSCIRNITVVV